MLTILLSIGTVSGDIYTQMTAILWHFRISLPWTLCLLFGARTALTLILTTADCRLVGVMCGSKQLGKTISVPTEKGDKMRLIDADKLKDDLKAWCVLINKPQFYLVEDADHIIDTQPAVDAVEVVRCKDCESFETVGYKPNQDDPELAFGWCWFLRRTMQCCNFCCFGGRRQDETD